MAATANDNNASHRVTLLTRSPEETAAIAAALADVLRGGEVVSLEGDLGAGKTFFAGALAHALGAAGPVTSPTFVLQKTYELAGTRLRSLVHYDVYRLADYSELADIGFEDLDAQSVALIEWGDRFLDNYASPPLRVSLTVTGERTRRIVIGLDQASRFDQFTRILQGRGWLDDDTRPETPRG